MAQVDNAHVNAAYLRQLGDIDAPGHNGLDGVYKKDGQYFIVEGKYSGSASLNSAMKQQV